MNDTATAERTGDTLRDNLAPASTNALVPHTDAEMRWMTVPREQMLATLRQSLYPGAADEMIVAVMEYCRAAGLNVMLRPVHIVPMYIPQKRVMQDGKEVTIPGGMRDVIMPGINHYRVQASRTGRYLGLTPIEWGPTVKGKLGGMDFEWPEYAKVAAKVKVGDDIVEFHAEEYFLECYATQARDKREPNAMWAKRPRGQLAKTVEAQALRKAFPELGDYTAEEMEGKTIDLVRDDNGTHRAADPVKSAAVSNLDAFSGGKAVKGAAAKSGNGSTGRASTGATTRDATRSDASDQSGTNGRDDVVDHTMKNAADATRKDDAARKRQLPTDETGEVPKMPAGAADDWSKDGKWSKAWRWINEEMPKLGPIGRQDMANDVAAILHAVRNANKNYRTAVEEFVAEMGVKVADLTVPLEK